MSERSDELEAIIDCIEDTLTRTFIKIALAGFIAGAIIGMLAVVIISVLMGRW